MTPIIAGRFEQEAQAERAAEALRQQGFAAEDVTVVLSEPSRAARDFSGRRRP